MAGVRGYREDLAYVHDAGFRDYALNAAPGLLRILHGNGVREGLIVRLGCGSGRWAAELNRSGHAVIGIDQSPSMVQLARRIARASTFRIGSLWSAKLPACAAVTSLGECLNYCFDSSISRVALRSQRGRTARYRHYSGASTRRYALAACLSSILQSLTGCPSNAAEKLVRRPGLGNSGKCLG
jgi:SAM-dependent methyltransferase